MPTDKQPYEWDFSGSCDPSKNRTASCTFSVGIFQWIPKSSGKGLKKGKVVKRIRGSVSRPQEVHEQARKWIEAHK